MMMGGPAIDSDLDAISFRPATVDDGVALRTLLDEAGLPSGDVAPDRQTFVVAVTGGALQGCVGLEPLGADALLRSLAVRDGRRHAGLGGALFERALHLATARRIETLFLLTTSAEAFFARRGFRTIARADAPEAVRASRQFSDLCPKTAVCMARRLSATPEARA